jgi:hypothetical protein
MYDLLIKVLGVCDIFYEVLLAGGEADGCSEILPSIMVRRRISVTGASNFCT